MNFLKRAIRKAARWAGSEPRKRAYEGAKITRLNSAWQAENSSANSEIRQSLRLLRARSRQVERDNAYMRKYGASLEANIIGSEGFKLQMAIEDAMGVPDTAANDAVEWAWWEAGASITVCGMSLQALKCMVIRRTAFDGEILLRKRVQSKQKHAAKLEVIEADRLDESYNTTLNGNRVVMGVEIDEYGLPIAYHIFNYTPNDSIYEASRQRERERVPASQIIHVFVKERPGQVRGVPWTSATLEDLHQLNGYEQAEVVAARAGAQKMGFLSHPDGTPYKGEEEEDDGSQITNSEAGVIEDIGRRQFTSYDPTHPNGNFATFTKTIVRKICSGLGESYNTLANDLEGVNYSSLRGGVLDARETYKMRQKWFAEAFLGKFFPWWLEIELTSGAIVLANGSPLPVKKLDKFNSPEWQGRRWQWVDPIKELDAIEKALKLKITSRKKVLGEMGEEIEETFRDIVQDEALGEKYKIDLTLEKAAPPPTMVPPPLPEDQ